MCVFADNVTGPDRPGGPASLLVTRHAPARGGGEVTAPGAASDHPQPVRQCSPAADSQLAGRKSKTGKIISRGDHARRCVTAKNCGSRGKLNTSKINYRQ
jgi:hypothetical protein